MPLLMTLSDLQGHSPNASLFKCDFSYRCGVVMTRFQLVTVSRDPSARAELLVFCTVTKQDIKVEQFCQTISYRPKFLQI